MTSDISVLMYSFLNLEPISCSKQGSNCYFLTCIQVSQETSKMVWYYYLSESLHSLSWSIESKAFRCNQWNRERCFSLKFPCFLYNSTNVDSLISSSSYFSKPAWTSGSSWFTQSWSLAGKILMTLLTWEMNSIVWWLSHCLVLKNIGFYKWKHLFVHS